MRELIKNRMKEIGINIHKLSRSCGIPHSYLTSLLNGTVQKPGRDKIIQVGISLYWGIEDVNALLKMSGHDEISRKDITFFVKAIENKGIFSGHNPIYPGTFNFAVTIMAVERMEGNVRLVTAGYPHAVFGKNSPNYAYETEKDALYRYIDNFLFEERKENFYERLKKNRITHLVCRKCFEEKIIKNSAYLGREQVRQTFRNLFECLTKEKNYGLKLIENCPKFEFHLKEPEDKKDDPVTVYAGSLTEHYKKQENALVGFVTQGREIYDIFLNEFNRLEAFTRDECAQRDGLIQYIVGILEKNGVGTKKDYADYLIP